MFKKYLRSQFIVICMANAMVLVSPRISIASELSSHNETNEEMELIVDHTSGAALSERAEIEGILDELHKMKHTKKSKISKKTGALKKSKNAQSLENRLMQAKELMGPKYKNYFQFAQRMKKPDRHIHEYVKEAFVHLDKKFKRKAHITSQTILSESRKYGFDPFFLLAVIENESHFDIGATGDAGEIGLMQILPETAKWICERNNWKWRGKKTLLNPAENIKIGAAYMNLLRQKFESESQLYISAYNMGPTNVYKALDHQVTPKDYHSRVLGFYISYYKQIKKEFEDDGAT